MKEHEAWLVQIDSDYRVIEVIVATDDASFRCHSVAKCQQVVEKSLNAIDAMLRDRKIIHGVIRAGHYPERMIGRLLRIASERKLEFAGQLANLLSAYWRAEVRDLCRLAPSLPKEGQLYLRNTEYPFNISTVDDWSAPAFGQSFTVDEVVRYRRVASYFRNSAMKLSVVASNAPR